MKSPYQIIKAIVHTEKGTLQEPLRKYNFWVYPDANKIEIAGAVENIYKVKVQSVNTMTVKGKSRRVRYQLGRTSDWKKAMVTLKPGNKIEVA